MSSSGKPVRKSKLRAFTGPRVRKGRTLTDDRQAGLLTGSTSVSQHVAVKRSERSDRITSGHLHQRAAICSKQWVQGCIPLFYWDVIPKVSNLHMCLAGCLLLFRFKDLLRNRWLQAFGFTEFEVLKVLSGLDV